MIDCKTGGVRPPILQRKGAWKGGLQLMALIEGSTVSFSGFANQLLSCGEVVVSMCGRVC